MDASSRHPPLIHLPTARINVELRRFISYRYRYSSTSSNGSSVWRDVSTNFKVAMLRLPCALPPARAHDGSRIARLDGQGVASLDGFRRWRSGLHWLQG